MSTDLYPPIPKGTRVKTTIPNSDMAGEWDQRARADRLGKFGEEGTVDSYSDSHGLCYRVVFSDKTTAWFDPSELERFA